jgi:dTDP-4-amino-4,6-dideoxygalactose transaminase
MNDERIFLSPPDIGAEEMRLVADAFASNWIAPLGPHVDAFEREFADAIGAEHAVAMSSGTAALHISLILAGVGAGDVVLVSTLTFSASVNPIIYVGATPHFIDSDRASWNMDPDLLEEALAQYAAKGRLPKAVMVVHLYGQTADMRRILEICARYGVTVIEDAAEALGATHDLGAPGTLGEFGVSSFNGNKIITTSGGGMLVTRTGAQADHARKLVTQAREPAPHYEHREIGYNYRLSNVLAAIGRGQLAKLDEKVASRRANFAFYRDQLGSLPGLTFMPEAAWGTHNRCLTVMTVDPRLFGTDREALRHSLEARNIEARPVWKPMHLQPVFAQHPVTGGAVSESLFRDGLCLPSGSSLTDVQRMRVAEVIISACENMPQPTPSFSGS